MSSSKRTAKTKPKKPFAGFPLCAHPCGQWCKKIRGRIHYFGQWSDHQAALNLYLEQREDLEAGRKPRDRRNDDGVTIRDLANRFLTNKRNRVDAGNLSLRSWEDYKTTLTTLQKHPSFKSDRLISDLRPDDFDAYLKSLEQRLALTTVGNEVRRIRAVFNYGLKFGIISEAVRFGPDFIQPTDANIERQKQRNGNAERFFEADEIRRLLAAAPAQLRAMILLAINTGFGNHDCGLLKIDDVDFEAGTVSMVREKTMKPRPPISLWPETLAALREEIARRKEPKDKRDDRILFLTKYRNRFAKDKHASPISAEFRKLLKRVDLYARGVGFYALRHTFATVAANTTDQVAVDQIMGHAAASGGRLSKIRGGYQHGIASERIAAVTDHVRAWLFDQADNQVVNPPALAIVG